MWAYFVKLALIFVIVICKVHWSYFGVMALHCIPSFSSRLNIAHNCIIAIFSITPFHSLSLYICFTRVKCYLTQTSKAMRQTQMKDEQKIPLPCTTDLIRKLSDSSFQTWLSHFKRKYFSFIYDCLSCTSHTTIPFASNFQLF